ncbi:MAG: lysophospholipid acyltransferase family protein [Bryobacteraceae bacterium]|nr:lysophospholipid acyltransferase family protein [Bryobacteraceae bacterium]
MWDPRVGWPNGLSAAQLRLQQAGAEAVSRLLHLDRLLAKRDAALGDPTANFYDGALKRLGIAWHCLNSPSPLPKSGPLVVVANHPTGFADGLILGSLLAGIRPDFKFLGNARLADMAPAGSVILLDLSESANAVAENARALRQALRWLNRGGAVIVFPSGEVAAFDWWTRSIREPAWKDTAARLAINTGATVVPIRVEGNNRLRFHVAGLAHPFFRTAMLVREVLSKSGQTMQIQVGRAIPAARLSYQPRAAQYLQSLVRPRAASVFRQSQVARQGDPVTSAAEVAALPASAHLLSQGTYSLYVANAPLIPHTLREIGRLRELSFRAAGEGSGNARDLDRFDDHYQHLFLWNRQTKEVIGAYRVATTTGVLATHGSDGLYTSSLFQFSPQFFQHIGPALELGRSFVRPEYQKDFAPLHLLWKGIGLMLAGQPSIGTLFGPVSISNCYRPESRNLMAHYLRRHRWRPELSTFVRARCRWPEHNDQSDWPSDLTQLNETLQDFEGEGRALPVLLRHYLNLNGQAVALSRDRAFSEVLDALITVDLSRVPPKMAARYLSRGQA